MVLDREDRPALRRRGRRWCRRTARRGSPSPPPGRLSRSTVKPWFIETISTLPVVRSFTGWFAPWWPCSIFTVVAPSASASIWWPRQMPNTGLPLVDQLPDLRHRVFAGRRRVAGAVGQQHAVRLARQDLLGGGRGRHHGGPRADRGQRAQDVALHAVVDHHHLVASARGRPWRSPPASSTGPRRQTNGCRQEASLARSRPTRPAQARALAISGVEVEAAVRAVGDHRRAACRSRGSPWSARGCRRRQRPTTPRRFSQPSRSLSARQLAGAVGASRKIAPRAAVVAAPEICSRSSSWSRRCRCAGR